MSRFFLGRPIFAWVIAIVIMLAGILSITRLPVSQYPQIAPPQVTITATYPGASAETIENTITQQIEQAMTGLDGYLYMASNSDSSGRVSIDITFEAGTDPDIAQVQVQNRLKTVENSLPQVVQQLGVNVDKSAANFLMVVGFVVKSKCSVAPTRCVFGSILKNFTSTHSRPMKLSLLLKSKTCRFLPVQSVTYPPRLAMS